MDSNKASMSTLTSLIQYSARMHNVILYAQCNITKKKKIESIQIRKKEVKLSLLGDDILST